MRKLAMVSLMVSLLFTFIVSLSYAKPPALCYFCGSNNDCIEQTGGSGWSYCETGGGQCYLGGRSCCTECQ